MLDLDRYLARIGLSGRPGLGQVHRAHVTTIPFENLDPYCGIPVSLALADLERKLVTERRGGYCFEQNLLLKAAFEALGAEVDLLLARVRAGRTPGVAQPRTHLALRVHTEGLEWLADAGFGLGGLFEPIALELGSEHLQSGWQFRLVEDGKEVVLQSARGPEWVDLYGYVPDPVPFVDVETSNWFTSTYPRSPFLTGVIISLHSEDGTRTMLRNWDGLALKEERPDGVTMTPVAQEALPELLATRFGLPGYALGADGRLVPAGPGPGGGHQTSAE